MPIDLPFVETIERFLLANAVLRLLGTALIMVVLLVLRHFVLQYINQRVENADTRYFWKQISVYVIIVLGAMLIARVWFTGVGSVLAVLSLIGAALTIANKELIQSFVAWPIITWRRLFGIGDRIQIGSQSGDVIDLGVLYFTLAEIGTGDVPEEHTGSVLKIPNALIFTQPVTNRSRSVDYLWNELEVKLTKESDWHRAEDRLHEIASRHVTEPSEAHRRRLRETNELAIYAAPNPSVRTSVRDDAVVLTLRYLCRTKRRYTTESAIWRELLDTFSAEEGIDVALS